MTSNVDVDVKEIRAQNIVSVPVLNIGLLLRLAFAKAIKLYFTAVSGSVNLSTKIINNLLICPEVIESILETVYRFCRDDITGQKIPRVNNSIIVK